MTQPVQQVKQPVYQRAFSFWQRLFWLVTSSLFEPGFLFRLCLVHFSQFVLITKDTLYYPLAVLATFIVIQSIESYLLTPNIIGNNVRLNPMAAFAGLLVGGMVWGIFGMILAIPLLSIGMQLMRLSDSTAPYAFLLGAPEKNKITRVRR